VILARGRCTRNERHGDEDCGLERSRTGNEVLTRSGAQVEAMLRADYDKWRKVIKASAQKAE
jgi:hypothetical protein